MSLATDVLQDEIERLTRHAENVAGYTSRTIVLIQLQAMQDALYLVQEAQRAATGRDPQATPNTTEVQG